MICATEQNVIVLDKVYDEVKAEFERRGCYFLQGDQIPTVGNLVITKSGGVNPKVVGQPAAKIAEMAGIEVPRATKVLIAEVTSVEPSEPWAHEKLTTVLGMYRAKDFDDAIAKASRLVNDGGRGHTSSLFVNVNEKEKAREARECDEDLPHPHQHPCRPGWHRRHLQLHAHPIAHARLRLLRRQLRLRQRRRPEPAQHQVRGGEA